MQDKAKKRDTKWEQAGGHRLAKFGPMKTIRSFCKVYPAYKFDEVFNLEYWQVMEALEEEKIIGEITELYRENDTKTT